MMSLIKKEVTFFSDLCHKIENETCSVVDENVDCAKFFACSGNHALHFSLQGNVHLHVSAHLHIHIVWKRADTSCCHAIDMSKGTPS